MQGGCEGRRWAGAEHACAEPGVHPTHSRAVLAPSHAQAAPGASVLPAVCTGSRFNPSQGPAALPSVPSVVSSGLEAGLSLLSVSWPQFFLCAEPSFLSAFRVLSSVAHKGSCPGWQRKRRRQEEAQFLL